MSYEKPLVIALDVKLKHYRDPETNDVIGVDQYETEFACRDRYEVLNRYVDAVQECGALPLMLPPFTDEDTLAAYLDLADGFLCVGINDYPPALYREPNLQSAVKDTEGYRRHAESNMILARMVMQERRMPTIGITMWKSEPGGFWPASSGRTGYRSTPITIRPRIRTSSARALSRWPSPTTVLSRRWKLLTSGSSWAFSGIRSASETTSIAGRCLVRSSRRRRSTDRGRADP